MQPFVAAGESPVALLPWVEVPQTEGTATMISVSFTDASVTASGLSGFARGMLGAGKLSLGVAFQLGERMQRETEGLV